jgi:polysaccharide biosynthesis transport protein
MNREIEAEEPSIAGFLATIPAILWHRRWLIIIPAVLGLIAAIAAAMTMHPIYESRATVLIESQQLPDELIGAGTGGDVNDAIGQRVARARERVLSRMDLIRMIRTYNLYPEAQRTSPLSAIVEKMRSDTSIQAVSSDIQIASGSRRNGLSTIAIAVAFRYDDPQKAQVVAQQYVDSFLEADASTQASQATDAVNFLTEQARDLQSRIGEIERRMAEIQSANGAVLALGQTTGDRTADLSRIDSDIARLQAENASLSAQAQGPAQDSAVTAAEAQLRVAQARFTDTHPDVIAARAQLEAARRAAASTPAAANPIAAQLAANRAQISSLQQARVLLSSQSANVSAAQSRAPVIAAQIAQLDKQADTLRDQYRTISGRLQAAQIQARMESEQKGERLTLADPPVVPDTPIRPDRPLIIVGGLIGGLGLGFALAMAVEFILRPIRGINSLKQAAGEAPLAVIPDFDQKPSWAVRMLERRTRRKLARA